MDREPVTGDGIARGDEGTPGVDGRVSVLLVDDDENWASSTARLLEYQREDFDVTTATDLAAASDAFEAGDADCVVCDHELEAGTGLDLLAAVRERDPERPFILVTGRGGEAVASDAIAQRVTDYIPKRLLSAQEDLLARRIETAVETYRTRRALARERRGKEAMLDILTATSTREGLARRFCEHLVSEHDYDCAWIGTFDGSNGVVPRAVAGAEGYVEAAIDPGTTPGDGTEPALVALSRREPHAVAPIEGDPTGEEWWDVATAHGIESALAVPIAHEGSVFGVLAVYGSGSVPHDTDLLAEYGRALGYALRSTGWKESLLSTGPVVVEVELDDADVPLVAFGLGLPRGSRIEVLTTVPREETLRYVVRVEGAAPTDVRTTAEGTEAVESVTVTRTDGPVRCELVVCLPTPETVLAENGGRIAEATVANGRAAITTVTRDGDVGPLVEAVRSAYPDASVRSVDSTDVAPAVTADDLLASLTDRQRRALELAFYDGYFERPREHDTTEVAEKMGVARQTLTQHLRAAQRKLLSGLFEGE